jgi:hypothetical protein
MRWRRLLHALCLASATGCSRRDAMIAFDEPGVIVCGCGLLIANTIWFATRTPWRRIVLGNVLLLITSFLVFGSKGCSNSGAPRWTRIHTHQQKGERQVVEEKPSWTVRLEGP